MTEKPTKAYGLVRDKDGNPRFDNPHNIPMPLWKLLTTEEQQHIRNQGGYPEGDK